MILVESIEEKMSTYFSAGTPFVVFVLLSSALLCRKLNNYPLFPSGIYIIIQTVLISPSNSQCYISKLFNSLPPSTILRDHRFTLPFLLFILVSMANNPTEGPSDDFFEQILGFPAYAGAGGQTHLAPGNDASSLSGAPPHMMLQLNSGDGSAHLGGIGLGVGSGGGGGGGFHGGGFPLGLSLEQGKGGFMEMDEASGSGKRYLDDVLHNRVASSSLKSGFRGQPIQNTVPAAPHPPTIRPRVRARRGQATDPHSIAERLRRERIAERVRALQELVPSVNKTDRAAMVDEIVDYVKFLRLQVKVLSMSRLGGAGAVAPLVTDIPVSSVEDEGSECGRAPPAWEKWSNDGTERQVAKLMEENVGAAMQFLQSKALCIMPISLASAIYHTQPPEATTFVKPESNPPP